jgi:hypothetical protein
MGRQTSPPPHQFGTCWPPRSKFPARSRGADAAPVAHLQRHLGAFRQGAFSIELEHVKAWAVFREPLWREVIRVAVFEKTKSAHLVVKKSAGGLPSSRVRVGAKHAIFLLFRPVLPPFGRPKLPLGPSWVHVGPPNQKPETSMFSSVGPLGPPKPAFFINFCTFL